MCDIRRRNVWVWYYVVWWKSVLWIEYVKGVGIVSDVLIKIEIIICFLKFEEFK